MKRKIFTLLIVILGFIGNLTAQTYPVSSSIVMPFPQPLFLADYSAPGSSSMQVTLKLNDYTITSLDVKLKFIIENGDISLTTKNDYITTSPITLVPGVPVTLKGSDLADALNLNNMDLEGISIGYLNQNGGKLPEGQYSFCVIALDNKLSKQVSLEACNVVFLQMEQPPTLLTPEDGAYVKPKNPQQIRINWQVSGGGQPSFAGMNTFKLMMYEITTPSGDPQNAVENSQAVKIYESQSTTLNNINLDFSTVLLVAGKQYVYRVQAMGPNGKQIFENDGYSEWRYFNYGYPTGGEIELDKPFDGKQFKKTDQKVFSWGVSDKGTDGQKYAYKVIIVEEEDSTKTYEETLLNGTSFHEELLAAVSSQDGSNFLLSKDLVPDRKYVWKVEAYSEGQMVAESDPQAFFSHSLIKSFYASNREIKVIRITNPDLAKLAGKARIQLSEDEQDFVDVDFDNIAIRDIAGEKIMTAGEINFDLSARDEMELEPDHEGNGPAMFEYISGKITKYGLTIEGKIKWVIPHAVVPGEPNTVIGKQSTYVMTSQGMLSGESAIEPFTTTLLDPKDFDLSLKATSLLQLTKNKFVINLIGSVLLPESAKSLSGNRIKVSFKDYQKQITYIEIDNLIGVVSDGLAPISNLRLEMVPLKTGILDFSEDKSPGKLSSDKGWKGFYVNEYKSRMHVSKFDPTNQIRIEEMIDIDKTIEGNNDRFWVSGKGPTFRTDIDLRDIEGVKFNTFPAKMIGHFDIKNGEVKNAKFDGYIKIPFVGEKEKFTFEINGTEEGLEEGFLNEDLTERDLVFNPFGNENRMEVQINRAVFENNEWICMNLDVNIPEIRATIEAIENFRVYGDNFVGVSGKNKSLTLDDFVVGKFKDIDLSITKFGAAYLGGSYALSYSAETYLSEGFSGGDGGPPVLEISSVMSTEIEAEEDLAIPEPEIEVPDNIADEPLIQPAGMDISIQNAIMEGNAYLLYTKNDPIWGTKFEGGLNIDIKMPIKFAVGANMVFGMTPKKMDYFYFDMYFEDKSGSGIPVEIGAIKVFNILGMEGRVYRHMKGSAGENGRIKTELAPNIMFGIGMYTQIMDGYAKGFIFQSDLGLELEIQGEGFKPSAIRIALSGETAFLNFNVRTGSSSGAIVKGVAKEAAKEVAKVALDAIFPITVPMGGTDLTLDSKGFDNGSIAIGDYNSGSGFKVGANVSKKPAVDIGFATGGFKVGGSADAAGSGSFDLKVSSLDLSAKVAQMNSADFNMNVGSLKSSFGGNIAKKKANFSFELDQTKLKLDVNAPSKSGLIGVAIAGVKFDAAANQMDKVASIGFEMNNAKFDMAFDGNKKAASLLADISGVELKTKFNASAKSGELLLATSSDLIEAKGSAQMALFRVEKGSDIMHFESDFSKKTGKAELRFPNNHLKGEIAETQAEIFLKHNDFEIGLMGKYDGTMGDLHLKKGDLGFDFGANINTKIGFLNLKKGSTSFVSKYNTADSSYVKYVSSSTMAEVMLMSNYFKTHYKDNNKEMLLQANTTDKSGRMLFSIPSFSFDGSFNATAQSASLDIIKGDVRLKNYFANDSAVINYAVGSKLFKVVGLSQGSGSVYFSDSDAGIASGFGFNKIDKSGSLLFQKGDLLIDIAANKTASTGKIILEKGDSKFHAIIADSSYIMTEIGGIAFAALQNSERTSVLFGDDNNKIGLSKLQNGGSVFLKAGSSQIDLSKIASTYSASFIDGDLSIMSEISPQKAQIDFTKDALNISTSVSSSSAFDFSYGDGNITSNIGGNIATGSYNLAVDADGWSGSVIEKFQNNSTEINLSKANATLELKYMQNTKSLNLGISDFAIIGGIDQGNAFLKSTYSNSNFAFSADQSTGVNMEMGQAKIAFTNIQAKQFDLGLQFQDHSILIKQVPLDGKPSLDIGIDGNPISADPNAFSFTVDAAGWTGSVATVFKDKSADISIANSDLGLDMVYNDKSKYLSFTKGSSLIEGGVKKGNGFFKTENDGFSAEIDENEIDFKTDIAKINLSNFQNNMFDMEMKVGGKKINLNPSLDNGSYSIAASIDKSSFQAGANSFSITIDEASYEGSFARSLTQGTNVLNISKGDYSVNSNYSNNVKTLKLEYKEFMVSGGVENGDEFFAAGYDDLKLEVNSNNLEFDFDGSTIEINNIANKQFDVEFLIGSENYVIKPINTANGYSLDAKVNGDIINTATAYDTTITSKDVHIAKINSDKYNVKITKNDLVFSVDFEANKIPEITVEKGNNSFSYTITESEINVDVNNYNANYKIADNKLALSQGNNSFTIDNEEVNIVLGKTKVLISESALKYEEDKLLVEGTNDAISVKTQIKGKDIDLLVSKTGDISAKVSADGMSVATKYIAGAAPAIDITKAGNVFAYQFANDLIEVATGDYIAKYHKIDHILEVEQNSSTQFKVSESLLALNIADVEFEATPNSFYLEKGDLSTYVDNSLVRIKQKVGSNNFKVEIAKDGPSVVSLASGDMSFSTSYVSNEVPEVTITKGSDEFGYRISDESISIFKNDYTAIYTKGDNNIILSEGDINSFSLSPQSITTSISGYNISASMDSLVAQKDNYKTKISADQVSIAVDDKLLEVNKDKSFTLAIAHNKSISATSNSLELVYETNKLKVGENIFSVEQTDKQISGEITNEGAILQKGDYKLTASTNNLKFEHGSDNLIINSGAISGKFEGSEFAVTSDKTISYKDADRELSVSEESLAMTYQGIGLRVLSDKVKVSINGAGEIIASKDLLSYSNDGFTLALDKPFSSPDFDYTYKDNHLKMNSTELSIGVGDKQFTAGNNKLIVKLDADHRIGFDDTKLDFKFANYEASYENYSKLRLSNGIQEFRVDKSELFAKLDDDNSIRTYLDNNRPAMQLRKGGKDFNLNTNGAEFNVAGFHFEMNPENYIRLKKEGSTSDDGLYVNQQGLKYIMGEAELKLGAGDKIIEMIYKGDNSLAYTKSSSLEFTIANDYKTIIKKDLSVSFQKDEHLIELNNANFMAGYSNTSLSASLKFKTFDDKSVGMEIVKDDYRAFLKGSRNKAIEAGFEATKFGGFSFSANSKKDIGIKGLKDGKTIIAGVLKGGKEIKSLEVNSLDGSQIFRFGAAEAFGETLEGIDEVKIDGPAHLAKVSEDANGWGLAAVKMSLIISKDPSFIINGRIQTGLNIPLLCLDAKFGVQLDKSGFLFKVGERNDYASLQLVCVGDAFPKIEGFFLLHLSIEEQIALRVALGLRFGFDMEGGFKAGLLGCNVEVHSAFGASFEFLGDATIKLPGGGEPASFRLNEAFVELGAHASFSLKTSVTCGNLDLSASAHIHGLLAMKTTDEATNIHGQADGHIQIGSLNKDFDMTLDHDF